MRTDASQLLSSLPRLPPNDYLDKQLHAVSCGFVCPFPISPLPSHGCHCQRACGDQAQGGCGGSYRAARYDKAAINTGRQRRAADVKQWQSNPSLRTDRASARGAELKCAH